MKALRARAWTIFLLGGPAFLLAAYIAQGLNQGALAYSVQDDVAAVRAYKSRKEHNEGAAAIYQQAVDLLVKQKYKQASVLLEQVLKMDPRCAEAYSSYGYCQTWLGLYSQGAETLAQAIGLDSTKPIYFYRQALCYFSISRRADAIVALNHALALKPDDGESLRLRARCQRHNTNDESSAIADFSQLIKINAHKIEALWERGTLYAQTGQTDLAMQDFNTATAIKRDAGEPYVARADIFYNQHKYRLAYENYTAGMLNGTDRSSFCMVQRAICLKYLRNKSKTAAVNASDTEQGKPAK